MNSPPPRSNKSGTLGLVIKVIGVLFGILLIVGPLTNGVFSLKFVLFGVLFIAGFAASDLIFALFGESAFNQTPSQLRREAKRRSDAILGRPEQPAEPEIPPEDFLKALSEKHQNE